MVSRLASQHVTVVLSGDGGDELFAGYEKYLVERRERRYALVPRSLRRALARIACRMPEGMRGRNFLHHLGLEGWQRYLDASTLFRYEDHKRLFRPEAFSQMSNDGGHGASLQSLSRFNGDWISAMQYLDLKSYLPLVILTKVDRMSMAHSIEARVPLLDHKLVEFAATIPPELKLRNGQTKYIFKQALRGLLPDAIIDRPKHGFAVPLGRWFRGRLGDFVRDLLLSDTSRQRGILDPAYIDGLIRLHESGRNLDMQLWTLISFELWCRTFLDSNSSQRRTAPPHANILLQRGSHETPVA
jgi:asparagine synthase (glutamine-hydrolysing)